MTALQQTRLTAGMAARMAGTDPLLRRGADFMGLIMRTGGPEVALAPVADLAACWAEVLRSLRRRPGLVDAADAATAIALAEAGLRAAPDPDLHVLLAHAGTCPDRALARFTPQDLGLTDPAYLQAMTDPVPQQPLRGLGSLVLIVKLTRRCNLRCTYCNDWREGADQGMTAATQALMIRRIAEDSETASARLIWHGGEPALLGLRRMLGFLWLQARLRRSGQRITNSVQTNGTLISGPVLTLWRLFGFSVSVSLDGPQAVHDRQRPGRRGEGSFAAVADGIARLKAAGIFSGALVVVTPEIASLGPAALLDGLAAAGVDHVALLPVRPDAGHGKGPYLPPAVFAGLLVGLFDHLRANPDLRIDLREVDALHAAWMRLPTGFCELQGPCVGLYFGVDPDGSLQHCDKFLGSNDFRLGNLRDAGFADLRASGRLAQLARRSAIARARLAGCRWFSRCKGWCPHEAHVAALRGTAQGCCGLAPVFDHFQALATSRGAACPA